MKRMMTILEERKEIMNFTDEKAPINDAVDLLLRDSSESSEKQSLPLDSISGNIIEMMIPGDETMVTAMTLAVKFLSDSPVALQKLVVRKLTLNNNKKKKNQKDKKFLILSSVEVSIYIPQIDFENYIHLIFINNCSLYLVPIRICGIW